MSLYDAMMIGVAGLDANSRALSISSSNIANVNTVGYKTSQSAFSTMLAAAGGPNAASGAGVMAAAQQNIVQQGLIFSTSSPTDLAISGNGFFCVNTAADKSGQALYTRAGSFTPDAQGNLRNATGLYLMGWPLVGGQAADVNPGALQAVNLSGLSGKGEPTTKMSLVQNLQASAEAQTYTLGDMAAGNVTPQFSRTINIYDTQGGSRPLKIDYVKTDANKWSYEISYAGDINDLDLSGTGLPSPLIGAGEIDFNSDGSLADVIPQGGSGGSGSFDLNIPWNPATSGLQPQDVTVDLGTIGKTDGTTQFDTDSVLTAKNVDGAVFGNVTGVTIDSSGIVYANYSNGLSEAAFEIPLATFANPDGLSQVSGNAFAQTSASGDVMINPADSGGAGTIASYALEGSTSDLATEFTNMITTQRAYSASAHVVTTASQMMDELIQMAR
ncbi:MAG TPA: flagellar hook protein FlgE [Rhizomicrobium sp.]|jgi:flagellar hook protein FlgE|nr:flagellar hook protein FlgE [Rhizomicrobium sp.]